MKIAPDKAAIAAAIRGIADRFILPSPLNGERGWG
jgi:hypothetical protein